MNKKCSKCNEEKPVSEFYFINKGGSETRSFCKKCSLKSSKEHYREFGHLLWVKNKVRMKELAHCAYLKNKTKRYESHRCWILKNAEKHKAYQKRWGIENAGLRRSYVQKRLSTVKGRLNNRMSFSIWHALHQNKNSCSWEALVGYTVEDLKKHLESQFRDGMSWNNHSEWHIDHIIPQSRFHFEKPEDSEFKICWGLANLQPLWARENQIKGAKTMEEWIKVAVVA